MLVGKKNPNLVGEGVRVGVVVVEGPTPISLSCIHPTPSNEPPTQLTHAPTQVKFSVSSCPIVGDLELRLRKIMLIVSMITVLYYPVQYHHSCTINMMNTPQ